MGASRRGYGHYDGKYREDDFAIRLFHFPELKRSVALIAIADGVSAKENSRLGAQAAVEGVIFTTAIEKGITELMTCCNAIGLAHFAEQNAKNMAWSVLRATLVSATDNIKRTVLKQNNQSPLDNLTLGRRPFNVDGRASCAS